MRFRQSRYAKHDMMAKIKEKRMGNVENIVKDKDILLELKEKEEILFFLLSLFLSSSPLFFLLLIPSSCFSFLPFP